MIVVLYEIRNRLFMDEVDHESSMDLAKRLSPNTFLGFMKKHGLLPPNTVGDERDHEEMIKEEIDARRSPEAKEKDHEDDITCFSISIINKKNQAFTIDCASKEGAIMLNKVNVIMEDGLRKSQRSWIQRTKNKSGSYYGPHYEALSEPL